METYYNIGRFVIAFTFIAQSAMLFLQASALRRHGQRFFVLLCISSICGLIYACFTGLPYFLPLHASSMLFFLKFAVFFGVVGGLLAIWGTALLFQSYRKLSEALAGTSTGSA
jgi:hypothetical protein